MFLKLYTQRKTYKAVTYKSWILSVTNEKSEENCEQLCTSMYKGIREKEINIFQSAFTNVSVWEVGISEC